MADFKVYKCVAAVPLDAEALAADLAARRAYDAYVNASLTQRARWADEAGQRRRAEREAAPPVSLTVDALLDRLGWSREYAEHFVQSYCDCGDSYGGWETCVHASDLGVEL